MSQTAIPILGTKYSTVRHKNAVKKQSKNLSNKFKFCVLKSQTSKFNYDCLVNLVVILNKVMGKQLLCSEIPAWPYNKNDTSLLYI